MTAPGVVGRREYYPAHIGRGSVIHLAYGRGMTVCGLNTGRIFHRVHKCPTSIRVSCRRCLSTTGAEE